VAKWIVASVASVVVVAAGVALVAWERSPKREIVRSRTALLTATSWHFHTERVFLNIPPETVDMDVVCPNFEHRTARGTRADGTRAVNEFIQVRGRTYYHVADEWQLAKAPASTFWDCDQHGTLLDGDGNSLPYVAILKEGTVQRGELRHSGDEACRDYDVMVPVPSNILEREYRFFLCINEIDHLPRETRRKPRGSDHEDVKMYSEWNEHTEPQLPADFPN
jgi:hypothetical protein